MTKYDIVELLARERRVERLVEAITHADPVAVADISQIIYLSLLEKREDIIVKAHTEGWLVFFVIRMVRTQWESKRSTYASLYTRYQRRASELTEEYKDYADDDSLP